MAILHDFEVVFAGRQPTEDELIALCEQHNPVAILVRYGKISAKIMDAAPALQVISKHGSGIDVIDRRQRLSVISPSALHRELTRRRWLNTPGINSRLRQIGGIAGYATATGALG